MTIEELKEIKENYINARKKDQEKGVVVVRIHMGTCGIAAGAKKIQQALEDEMEKLDINNVKLRVTGCAGLCSMEPMITVSYPKQAPVKYGKLDEKKAQEIFYSHIIGGYPKAEYAIGKGYEAEQKRTAPK